MHHSVELHNPGYTGEYPFLGHYKVDKEVAHGHAGVSRHAAATSLGLRITGSNVVVENISLPATDQLQCFFEEGTVGRPSSGAKGVPFRYEGQRIVFPNNGRGYNLVLHTSKNRGSIKHQSRLQVTSGAEGDVPWMGGAGTIDFFTDGPGLGGLALKINDAAPVPIGNRAFPTKLPGGAQVALQRTANPLDGEYANIFSDPDHDIDVAVGGATYRGTPDVPARVPLSLFLGGEPVRVASRPHRTAVAASMPAVNLGFDALPDGSTVAYVTLDEPRRIVMASASNPALRAEGRGTCQLVVPKNTVAVTIDIYGLTGDQPEFRQTVKLPTAPPGANAHAMAVKVEDQPNGARLISSAGDVSGCATTFSTDNGATWSPSVTVVSSQNVSCRLMRKDSSEVLSRSSLLIKPIDFSWLDDLNRALADPIAGPDDSLARRLGRVNPSASNASDLLRHLQDLLGAPPPTFEADADRLNSLRCPAHDVEVSIAGRKTAIAAGQPIPLTTDGSPIEVTALQPKRRSPLARLVVSGGKGAKSIGSQETPQLQFRTRKPNTLENIRCPGADSLRMRREGSSVFDPIMDGGTVQLHENAATEVQAVDPNGAVLAQCLLRWQAPEDTASPVAEWDNDYLNNLLKAVREHKPNRASLRAALLPLAPSGSKPRELNDGLLATLQSEAPLVLSGDGGSDVHLTIRLDDAPPMPLREPISIPPGTKRVHLRSEPRAGFKPLSEGSVSFEVAPGRLSNVRPDDPAARVFADVGGRGKQLVPPGASVPFEGPYHGDTPVTVDVTVEDNDGKSVGRRIVVMHPQAAPQQSDQKPVRICYEATRDVVSHVHLESVFGGDVPADCEILLSVNDDRPQRVLPGENVRLPTTTSAGSNVLKFTARNRLTGRDIAATTARIAYEARSGLLEPARPHVRILQYDDKTIVRINVQHPYQVRVATDRGMEARDELSLDARQAHRVRIVVEQQAPDGPRVVCEELLEIPRLLHDQSAPDFNIQFNETSITCATSPDGIATISIDGQPETNLAALVPIASDTKHDARISLRKLILTDDLLRRPENVATLRLKLRPFVDPDSIETLIGIFDGFEATPKHVQKVITRLQHFGARRVGTVVGRLGDRLRDVMMDVYDALFETTATALYKEMEKKVLQFTSQKIHFRLRGDENEDTERAISRPKRSYATLDESAAIP
jgi:hypothetical protein